MSLLMPRISTATSAPSTANGTESSTAKGSDQRSYCAARIRNTMISANPKANVEALPTRLSWKACPAHSSA